MAKALTKTKRLEQVKQVKPGEEIVPGIRLRHCLRGAQGTIGRIAWSPDGAKIASPDDNAIRIWDTTNARLIKALQTEESRGSFYDVAWSANGKELAVVAESMLFIGDIENTLLSPISFVGTGFWSRVIWGPNKRYISFSTKQRVAVWDLQQKETFHFHNREREGQRFPTLGAHPDGDRLVFNYGENILIRNVRKTPKKRSLFNEKSDDDLLDMACAYSHGC